MDRCAKRYACPSSFMQAWLDVGRFTECVRDIIRAMNRDQEDKQDRILFDLYLHRYTGNKSFGEWKDEVTKAPAAERVKPKIGTKESMKRNLEIAFDTLESVRKSTDGKAVT